MKPEPPLLWVRWLDTGLAVSDGWMSPEHIKSHTRVEAMEVVSVGFLFHEDEDVLVLTQSYDAELDQHLNAVAIATSSIKERRSL